MGITEVFLIGVGLSMDAFAVSICRGLAMKKIQYLNASVTALFFGVFQAVMPVIGWFAGKQFEKYIVSVDHWIAFGLLLIIGGKMILDVIRGGDSEEVNKGEPKIKIGELTILAIATSIDALAVGISFAFLQVKIVRSVIIIGITTLIISFLGVIIGNKFGSKYEDRANLLGGIILIAIGLKILLEHLGVF